MIYVLNALTGDETNTVFYILLAVAILGILVLTILPKIFSKKSDTDNNINEGLSGSQAEENNVSGKDD